MKDINEQKVALTESNSELAVDVSGQSFIMIMRDGREVVVERGPGGHHRFTLPPGEYIVRTDGKVKETKAQAAPKRPRFEDLMRTGMAGSLRLSDSLTNRHPADGVGLLPADGKSAATITVERVDANGTVVTTDDGQELLYVRATGGMIKDKAGNATSRLQLSEGKTTFQLVAESSPRFVTVTVLGQTPGLRAELSIDIVAPSELSMASDGR